MNKFFTKTFFLVTIFLIAALPAIAQTITIGTVDAGPYGSGSGIAVPFHVNDASGCIQQNNVYSLYLCNASGTPIGAAVDTIKNFYGAFFNYKVPAGLAAGTYTFLIKSSSPAVSSNVSTAVTINSTAGPAAAATCQSNELTNQSANPGVFGTCSGSDNKQYFFTNTSASSATTTISFFNELSQTMEVSNADFTTNYTFAAKTANYTIFVKAVNNGIVSIYAYKLINNVVNTSIGATGNPSICLSNGTAPLTYNVDISSALGIQNNYPGNLYTFSWGDGTPNSIYTLCQIEALNGKITHVFTKSSCGVTANNNANSFEIDFQATNNYCGKIGSAPSNYAKVFVEPINNFTGPVTACTGNPVVFINTSQPGPDPNATISSCADNPNALYSWSVDGVLKAAGYHLNQSFVYTFTEGTHTVSVHLQNPATSCSPTDYSQIICIQNQPKPNFAIAQTTICIGDGPVVPVNTSVVDATCNTNNSYNWTVTPSTGVTFNASSPNPSFGFTQAGVYTIGLNITTASCGTFTAPNPVTIVVNSTPVATLSKDFSMCGNNQTLTFNAVKTSPTYTILTGTTSPTANTYTWNVTGGTYSYAPGYTLHSQYPQIIFNDFGVYTISVTQTNNCGTATSQPQHITFVQAPTVVAGTYQPICYNGQIALHGTVTGTGVTGHKWVGGTGTYTNGATSLQTGYIPSAAEVAAGQVTLTLDATTALPSPCNDIESSTTIIITPADKLTSTLAKSICSGTPVNYTITAQDPASTYTWTAKLISGTATGFTASGTGSLINDNLVNTDPNQTTNAVIAYTITPFSANGCEGIPATLNVTITPLPIAKATVVNAVICSNESSDIALSSNLTGTSYTWTSTTTGNVTGNSNQTIASNTSSIQDILINNGTTAAKVTYIITPISASGCPGTPIPAVVNVQPLPVTSYAGANTSLCNTTNYQLQGNSPGAGTGKWTVINGTGAVFTDDTSPTTTVTGLTGGMVYKFQWTITTAPGCSSQSAVIITVNMPTVAGTTSSSQPTTVCAGSNSGQIDLTGQVGNILNWESSVDNGATWQAVIPQNTTNSLLYSNLNQTTIYRADVQNGICDPLTSTPITITVNQPAIIADAGSNQTLCSAVTYTLQGNNPGAFKGMWSEKSGPPVTFADPTNYQTAVSNLQPGNIYVFTWTIMGVSPCADSKSDVTITDAADVIASFTADQTDVCSTTTITFTNTSNNQAGAQFFWDFGDGSTSTAASPQHQFVQDINGKDETYTVSLTVLNNCNIRPAVTQTIIIRPDKPIASIRPTSTTGCSPFTLTVENTSPTNDVKYQFYLTDGTNIVQEIDKTDKTDAVFDAVNVPTAKVYTVYMTATGHCGATNTSNVIPIPLSPPTVFPGFYVVDNNVAGCAPLSVSFANLSKGGSSYHYNIYDSNGNLVAQPIAGTDNFPYTFTTAGNYMVSISAGNSCSPNGIESAKTAISVYPVPVPTFTTNTDCNNLITFSNTTAQNGTTPATSLSYTWDFGDGSAQEYTFIPRPHQYNYNKSPFTVTLTVTNTVTGCSDFIKQTLNVDAPLAAQFTEKPDSVISIPNYHFSFVDESTGAPIAYSWTFGDGMSSTTRNPEHTYADTGYYQVTLNLTGKNSCLSTVTHTVRITGIPGQLYLPNAFIPGSGTTELRTFMAKGSGIKTWLLQVYNNYGQLVWQTTKLDSKGAPVEGWDGTFKGTPMPQGAYIWQASATFINGSQWKGMSYNNSLPKRTGTINLIR